MLRLTSEIDDWHVQCGSDIGNEEEFVISVINVTDSGETGRIPDWRADPQVVQAHKGRAAIQREAQAAASRAADSAESARLARQRADDEHVGVMFGAGDAAAAERLDRAAKVAARKADDALTALTRLELAAREGDRVVEQIEAAARVRAALAFRALAKQRVAQFAGDLRRAAASARACREMHKSGMEQFQVPYHGIGADFSNVLGALYAPDLGFDGLFGHWREHGFGDL